MSTPSKNSNKDTGAAKAQLAAMEETRAQLWAQQEKEEREMEAVIVAKVERVAEEEREVEVEGWAEVEHCQRAEEAKRQWVLEECHQQVEVEQRRSSHCRTPGVRNSFSSFIYLCEIYCTGRVNNHLIEYE